MFSIPNGSNSLQRGLWSFIFRKLIEGAFISVVHAHLKRQIQQAAQFKQLATQSVMLFQSSLYRCVVKFLKLNEWSQSQLFLANVAFSVSKVISILYCYTDVCSICNTSVITISYAHYMESIISSKSLQQREILGLANQASIFLHQPMLTRLCMRQVVKNNRLIWKQLQFF